MTVEYFVLFLVVSLNEGSSPNRESKRFLVASLLEMTIGTHSIQRNLLHCPRHAFAVEREKIEGFLYGIEGHLLSFSGRVFF